MRTNNRDQDEPEFSILAWEAMLFSAGIGQRK
jgi:choline-glycine betaine transporter